MDSMQSSVPAMLSSDSATTPDIPSLDDSEFPEIAGMAADALIAAHCALYKARLRRSVGPHCATLAEKPAGSTTGATCRGPHSAKSEDDPALASLSRSPKSENAVPVWHDDFAVFFSRCKKGTNPRIPCGKANIQYALVK